MIFNILNDTRLKWHGQTTAMIDGSQTILQSPGFTMIQCVGTGSCTFNAVRDIARQAVWDADVLEGRWSICRFAGGGCFSNSGNEGDFTEFQCILHHFTSKISIAQTHNACTSWSLSSVYHLFNSLVESLDVELVDSLSFRVKVCLESQEARERERQWLKHQTTGELDENRLVVTLHNWQRTNRRLSEVFVILWISLNFYGMEHFTQRTQVKQLQFADWQIHFPAFRPFRMVSPAARRSTCAAANRRDLPLDASNIPSGSLLSWTSSAACASASRAGRMVSFMMFYA